MTTAADTDNPFMTEEAWETSLDKPMFDVGDYVATIELADDGTAGTGNPQVVLRFESDTHSIRAWETYHENFLAKIVALFDAAGIDRPQDDEFDPSDHCRLTEACRRRLLGQQVGIVVREEKDNRPDHYGETQIRVKGYVDPSLILADPASPAKGEGLDDDVGF